MLLDEHILLLKSIVHFYNCLYALHTIAHGEDVTLSIPDSKQEPTKNMQEREQEVRKCVFACNSRNDQGRKTWRWLCKQ